MYEIIKSKRGFFRRLGDAFRRQLADTVGVTNILNDIQNEEQKQNSRQQENVAARLNRQQRVPPYSTITCPKAEKRNDMT